ncbi:MAG: toxic anion resistance protein [Bacilli bacterium]|nr:toxic anion resistance protein [Bacilli bacterium]
MKNEIELKVVDTLDLDEIKNTIEEGKEITEEKAEKTLDYNKLTKDEQKAIDEFIEKIDVNKTNEVITFGAPAQTKITQFSDEVLENVKTRSIGEVGDLLADLTSEIKSFDASVNPNMKPSLFNSIKKQISKIIAKFSKVETNINAIEKKLETHKIQMMKDIEIFDQMYDKNLEYFKELSLYIIAGMKKVEELKTTVLPELEKAAKESGEVSDIRKVNDMNNLITRFEKKLYDLKTTRIISIQMAPQIRLIQNNDAELVDKIQSSITNTIPLWKNQMVIALGISNAKQALNAQKEVSELTNEMLKKNSETLKQGSIEIAKESERAIVDLETLKKTNSDLITTLEEIVKIHAEGRKQRAEAEVELNKIENELKDKLMNMKEQTN